MSNANEFGPGHYPTTDEVSDRPTPVQTGINADRWFGPCDANGEGGTQINAMWLNLVIAELRNAYRKAGAAGGEANEDKLGEAMGRYASGGQFCQDSGSANAYVLSSPLNFVMPKAPFDGQVLLFYPTVTNTGASTVNPFTTGAKAILDDAGNALVGGELRVGVLVALIYKASLTSYLIMPWSMPARASALRTGQCYLWLDGSNLRLSPENGNSIVVNAKQKTIPDGGISLAPTGLTPGTGYFLYLVENTGTITSRSRSSNVATLTKAGHGMKVGSVADIANVGGGYDATGVAITAVTTNTFSYSNTGSNEGATSVTGTLAGLTIETSATGHARDATTGFEVKSGDASQAYIGNCEVLSGPAFADSGQNRCVCSWFNPKKKQALVASSGSTSSTSIVEVSSSQRLRFCTEANRPVEVDFSGEVSINSVSWAGLVGVLFDDNTALPEIGMLSAVGTTNGGQNASFSGVKEGLAVGKHYATLMWGVSGGSLSFTVGFGVAPGNIAAKSQFSLTIWG